MHVRNVSHSPSLSSCNLALYAPTASCLGYVESNYSPPIKNNFQMEKGLCQMASSSRQKNLQIENYNPSSLPPSDTTLIPITNPGPYISQLKDMQSSHKNSHSTFDITKTLDIYNNASSIDSTQQTKISISPLHKITLPSLVMITHPHLPPQVAQHSFVVATQIILPSHQTQS